MTIEGTGAMYDYHSMAPWASLSVEEIILPDGLTYIGSYAFYGCDAVMEIDIPATVTGIGRRAFAKCEALSAVEIPDSVLEIGESAFWDCTGLVSVQLPGSLTVLSSGSFYNCYSLENITLPDTLTEIGASAFYQNASLKSISIPASVKTIQNSAFERSSIQEVSIPAGVTDIGSSAFSSAYLQQISVDPSNQEYQSYEGVLYSVTEKSLMCFPAKKGSSDLDYSVLEGTTQIDDNAFYIPRRKSGEYWEGGRINFRSLTLPDSYTVVTTKAFENIGADALMFSSSLEEIRANAFSGYCFVRNMKIPKGIAPKISGNAIGDNIIYIHVPSGARGYDTSPWIKADVLYDLDAIPLTGIALSCMSPDILVGETAQMTCVPSPADATEDYEVIWTISDESIATVDQNGIVTGVSCGSVNVKAIVGEFEAECVIGINHVYGTWATSIYPGYKKKGEKTKTCLYCGNSVKKEIPAAESYMQVPDFILPLSLEVIEKNAFDNLAMHIVACPDGLKKVVSSDL